MSRRGATLGKIGLWSDESGAAAALYALALPALVAVAGIAFDYARVAAMDSELQNAADQAALAAATQLDRRDGAVARARSAATTFISNETRFANDGAGRDVANLTVRIYATQGAAETCADAGALADTAFAQAAFVCVQVNTRTANYALTPIVGALRGDIFSQAVAGLGSALCRTPPLMICNPNEAADPSAGSVTSRIGQGLLVVRGGGGSWSPGNFGYLDTGLANGAVGVRMALGWVSPPGNCISQSGADTVDTEPGNMASVTDALNTRFDVYDNQGCETGGICPPSLNSRKDLVRASNANGNNSCRIQSQGWNEPATLYDPAAPGTTPTAMGHPRDVCHALATNRPGACTTAFGDGDWHRDTYFRTHYLRTEGAQAGTRWEGTATWTANTGLPSNATRYQVYLWEMQNVGQLVDGVRVLGPSPANATGNTLVNHGTPICSQQQSGGGYGSGTVPSAAIADRRRLSVAVVNCTANNVNGNSRGVPVQRWMDVFLVEPSYNRSAGGGRRGTGQDQIYVEVIGETSAGSSGETAGAVVRRDLPYLVK